VWCFLQIALMHVYGLKGGVENGSGGRRDFVTANTTHWFGQGKSMVWGWVKMNLLRLQTRSP